MSNLMINQLNGGQAITATMSATAGLIPIQLPATASIPNNTAPISVAVLAGIVAVSSGLGNMALQNATTVAITGGTVVATGGSFSATGVVVAFNGTAPPTGGQSGLLLSSVANFGIFFGSGTPTTSAAQGSLYLRTDGTSTSTRLYVNSNGATAWAAVTTAS